MLQLCFKLAALPPLFRFRRLVQIWLAILCYPKTTVRLQFGIKLLVRTTFLGSIFLALLTLKPSKFAVFCIAQPRKRRQLPQPLQTKRLISCRVRKITHSQLEMI
jgi:hypothetical protein